MIKSQKKTSISVAPKIFLFHGEDSYTTAQKARFWIEAFAKKYGAQGIGQIDCEKDENWEAVLKKLLESQGLFTTTRLVVVRHVFTQKAEKLESVLELLPAVDAQTFLLFWEEVAVKKNLKLYKKIASLAESNLGRIHEHAIPTGFELNQFIARYASGKKYHFGNLAVEGLAQNLGRDLVEKSFGAYAKLAGDIYNLWQVTSEIDKLGIFANGKEVTPNDVDNLVLGKVSDNIFAFTNALGARNKKDSRKYLDQLFFGNFGDAKTKALPILGALASQFRSLLLLSTAKEESRSAGDLADALGWTPYRVNANLRILNNFSKVELQSMLAKLLQIDKKIKTSTLPPKVLLGQLVNQL